MSSSFTQTVWSPPMLGCAMTTTRSGIALDSNYSFSVSGDCVAVRFAAPRSTTLTDVYFFVSAKTGAPTNATVELRNYSSVTTPGGTLHASGTVAWPAASKWAKLTFGSPYSLVQGTTYFVCIGDAAGSAGNNATVLYRSALAVPDRLYFNFEATTTTGGFAAAGTNQSCHPPIVLKFGDGTYWGHPWTTATNYTSNQLERGYLLNAIGCDMWLYGAVFAQGTTTYSGMKVYESGVAPGGTALSTITFGGGESACGAAYFAPIKLHRGKTYRVVFTFASNTTNPVYNVIEDYATYTELSGAGLANGTVYDTIDNGAGGWTDSPERAPRMSLLFSELSGRPVRPAMLCL